MQDEIAESQVRDHGECMQQLYFFSIRLCWDVEIVYFTYAGGESVLRICRQKTPPQVKKHWVPGPPLCWDLVVVKGL